MGQPYYFGTCVSGNFGFGNLYCFTVNVNRIYARHCSD